MSQTRAGTVLEMLEADLEEGSAKHGDLFNKCQRFTKAKELMEQGIYPYFRAISQNSSTRATIGGKEYIMAGSNNYLGLTHDPRVLAAAKEAIDRFGSSCTGSRFLNGTLELHEELERRLARFMKMDSALVFSTGYQVNLGVISALVGKGDIVYSDRENHACIIDGCRLALGEFKKYRHGRLDDLERALSSSSKAAGKLIVVDGVFSMNGSISDLPGVLEVARRYNARVMVDDAHGIGVLGRGGRGTIEHYDLLGTGQVDLVMGTFSKAFASIGGFIAGPEEAIHYIKHHARSLIFSASASPANSAAALAALDIVENEGSHLERLHRNVAKVKTALDQLGYDTMGSKTPIVPVLIGELEDTFRFWSMLTQAGLFTNPVVPPATPPGQCLIRTSYTAQHTDDELDQVIRIFRDLAPLCPRNRYTQGVAIENNVVACETFI